MSKLNAKQEMFCKEYLRDLNATQAAIRAGYSPKTAQEQSSRLLSNVMVLARVRELKDKRAEELELDAYWVLKRLMDVSNRCMQAEPVLEWDTETRTYAHKGEWKFDSLGATKSAELVGKHIGLFNGPTDEKILRLKLQLAEKELQLKDKDIALKQTQIDKIKGVDPEEYEDDGWFDATKERGAEVWDRELSGGEEPDEDDETNIE